MAMSPKVSIVIPVYNSEAYLHECIQSALTQTLNDIEIICIDDGSTDGSLAIIQYYSSIDSRIVTLSKENKGYGHTINRGFDLAKGEYLAILESDDYIVPHMLATLYQTAKDNHDLDFVKSDFCRFYGAGKKRRFERVALTNKKAYYHRIVNPGADMGLFRLNNLMMPGVYRREFVARNGIRLNETPGASYQDNGFWFQVFSQAQRAYFLNEPLYMIRRDNANSSVKSTEKVYCMCEEYDFINSLFRQKQGLHPDVFEVSALMRFCNYLWTLGRIAPEHRHSFVMRFSEDFYKLQQAKELNRHYFDAAQWRILNWIIDRPEEYYQEEWSQRPQAPTLKKGVHTLRERLLKVEEQMNELVDLDAPLLTRAAIFFPKQLLKLARIIKGAPGPHQRAQMQREVYSALEENQYPAELKKWYEEFTGEELDFDNLQTYNQKLQWLKLYDATPIKATLADKYLMRKWIEDKLGKGYLVDLLGAWDNYDEIDFSALPERFVLKTNHSSGWNLVVKRKNSINHKKARLMFDTWLSTDFALCNGFELQYRGIPPKIIAERFISNNNDELVDYRVMCFSGKPYSVWVEVGSGTANHYRDIYDLDWILQPVLVNCPNLEEQKPRPQHYELMLEMARTISEGFSHARVDFYEVDGKLYVGEITFTPQSGRGVWDPPEANKLYGDQLTLPLGHAGSL